MKNSKVAAFAISAIAFIALIAGTSYAYFQATITGTGNTNTVTSGTMKITFTDGAGFDETAWVPGSSVSKTFTIENTGSLIAKYKIKLNVTKNEFSSNLYYTLQQKVGDGTPSYLVAEATRVRVPATTGYLYSQTLEIAAGTTNTYTLTVKLYNDTSTNQVDDMNKAFTGTLAVEGVTA